MAEYVIRVVVDASGAKPAIANTTAAVGNVEKAAKRSSRSIKQVKTEAEVAATALAKMASAATNGLSVKGSLADVLRAGRVQADLFNTDLQKMQTAAKAGLSVVDKGLQNQLKASQAEAKKLAGELYRVSKAAQQGLAMRAAGPLASHFARGQAALMAPAGPTKEELKRQKEDRDWARRIFETSTGAQDKLAARTSIGTNLIKTRGEVEALATSMRNAGKASNELGSSLGRIAAVAAAGMLTTLIAGVIHLSDEFTVLTNKLRGVTDGQDDLVAKTEETFALAQRLRAEWGATAQVYGRITRSTKELGLSEDQVMKITENLTKAIKVSGATANETKSVLLQLGQAFGSGRLNGDEFRSVMENAAEIGNVLADSMGVTRGELKALSAAGRITSTVLAKAFLAPHRVFNEFSSAVPTFAERFTVLRNAAVKAVGEWAKSSTLVQAFGKAIEFAAEHVTTLTRIGAALGTLLAGSLAAYAIPKAIVAFHALTAAMMANPWIAAATAISVLAVALGGLGSELEKIDRKDLGKIIADPSRRLELMDPAKMAEFKKVLEETAAATQKMEKAFEEINAQIRAANSLMGQMAARVSAANSAVDVVKSIRKMSLETTPALIEAVTEANIKNVEQQIKNADEAKAAYKALKSELERLAQSADPMVAKVLEWNEAEKTLNKALRAKIITLQEQKALLDATYERIFDTPVSAAAGSGAIFANSGELAKTAVAREDLLLQMGEEQRAVERSNKLYLDLMGVQGDYVDSINAANAAFREGRVAFSDYLEMLEDAELALLAAERGTKSLEYGIASGWDAMVDQATDVAGAVQSAFTNAFSSVENAIVDLVVTGETNFKQLVDGMLADVTRILARLAFASLLAGDYGKAAIAGGAVGAGGLLSALGGLRTGGQFTVGGTGGPDSQVVAFRATPNETVTVQTPAQRSKGNFGEGGTAPIVRIYNVNDSREVSAIDTPAGGRAINNVIRKNPQIVRSRNR